MTLDTVIFMVSAAVAVFGATMMISQRNPVGSVLYFILSLLAQAVVYVQLGALFLGAILIVVYAGAIMVLFLFVIMLLNLRSGTDLGAPMKPLSMFTKITIPLLLVLEFFFVVHKVVIDREVATGIMSRVSEQFGSVREVATLLFTDYMYPFQLTGLLLLIAVVGAVVIARRESPGETTAGKAQEVRKQTDEVAG
jgi:NADH-quinone oxidoreductase subunit J